MKIAIKNTTGGLLLGRRQWLRVLPDGWQGIHKPAERLRLLRLCIYNPGAKGRVLVLRELLNLPQQVFLSIMPDQMAEILTHLAWLDVQADATPIVPHFKWAGTTYHLPSAKFANGQALEYPIADEFYISALAGQDNSMLHLVATLCRPARPKHEAEKQGDIRQPLHSRAEIDARVAKLHGLPTEVQIAVLCYFAGVKKYVHETYSKWLFPKPNDPETEDTAADGAASGDMFGWYGVYMTVAELGVFGNLDAVHQTGFHTICMYLVKKKQEAIEAENRLPSTVNRQPPTAE